MNIINLQWRMRAHKFRTSVALVALLVNTLAPVAPAVADSSQTTSPIKHVIVIIGENRSFDHVFATYKPVNRTRRS